jgi:HlyD family secretion protein
VRSADAQADEKRRVLVRVQDLFKRGIATQAQLDEAITAVEVAQAAIGQAEANLAVAKLPARPEAIKAAENQVKQSEQALAQARWRLSKRTLQAPASGRIDDIIRNPGDVAGPTAPVISMLPDGAVKLTLFVAEPAFSSVAVGEMLSVHCDGCGADLKARVSYVSPDPEFTPPVIYSLETRQKLVYLVEARPEGDASMLQPGQIVDVALGE